MPRVLVIDDDPASRELVREILAVSEIQVVEAVDGRQALERIAEAQPDLVLLDIRLPFLDGYEVLRRIRGNPRLTGLRVAAVTAYAMEGDREKALSAGFDAFISKPIQAAALRRWVEELIGS